MGALAVINEGISEVTLLRLARELAKEINPTEVVLEHYKITPEEFEGLKTNRFFTDVLASEVAAWNSASNTGERVKLKAQSMMEEWLVEGNERIHDRSETLAAKNETVKIVSALAGMGKTAMGTEGGTGERFTVTINLGADQKLQFTKDVTPKVIEGAPPTE